MTTTLIIDGSTAPDPRAQRPSAASRPGAAPQRSRSNARLSFGGLLRAERIKLSSLRSVRVTLLATLAAGFGLSTLIAFLWGAENLASAGSAADLQQYLLMSATVSTPFLALVFGVLGVLVMSSEYASGLILSTLVAAPRRMPVFLAKATVLAVGAAAMALIVVGAGLVIAALFDPAAVAEVWAGQVVTGVLGTALYLTLLALFAFGVATLTRNAAAAIGVVAGVTFVAPIAFSMLMMSGWDWVPNVAQFLPTQLGSTLSQGIVPAVQAGEGLTFWGALAAMVAWVVAAGLPAALVFARRDAN